MESGRGGRSEDMIFDFRVANDELRFTQPISNDQSLNRGVWEKQSVYGGQADFCYISRWQDEAIREGQIRGKRCFRDHHPGRWSGG